MSSKLYGQLRDFSLGINQKDGPTLVADQELVDAENAVLGKGFVQKRSGYEAYAFAPTQSTLYLWSDIGGKEWSDV